MTLHVPIIAREDMKDEGRFGHPKTNRTCENLEKVQLVRSDRWQSTSVIVEELRLDRESLTIMF